MGRKSLNRTYEQLLEHRRLLANKYYAINRDSVNQKRRAIYNKLKNDSLLKNNP